MMAEAFALAVRKEEHLYCRYSYRKEYEEAIVTADRIFKRLNLQVEGKKG
jgi:hypothetical protein